MAGAQALAACGGAGKRGNMGGRWVIVGDGRRERIIRMSGGRANLVWEGFHG